ncbi:TolC family outer membrane protein [Fulvimonas soli]|jgi:outer membrane protein|uniref:Outer membrane protein n=1 Tax=Fulvimonas soli TaxID=155197 RepID=A0A316I8C3_9GAMM|nr:TolC family outer membrane protein [Fulvimonas soli]PWK86648.1 outer membrane protein [Fulvimonas soli]TNY26332.1 type I secretion protein TolC [Fulvimonas soli]
MRLKLLTLALALSAISLPGHGEDLLDAYREARANDPVLSQAEATRLATGEGVTQARALLLPQVNGSASLSQSSGANASTALDESGAQINGGHVRTRSESLTLDQTILDLSKIADLHAARSQAQSQDATYQAALQDLFVRVTAAYFNVLTSEDQLAFAKANEEALKRAYDQAEQRFNVGLAAITDEYQAKSAYELARAQTIAAQNTLNDAREALRQITGKPVGELKKLREDLPLLPPTPNDPDTWVQEALRSNPNIAAQQYNVEAAEHSVNAAKAGHLPTLNAQVSRGTSSSWMEKIGGAFADRNGRYGTTVGVTLSVPIFAGGATQSRVRQSIYQRDAAEDALESQRRQVTRDTLNFYRSVLAGISQVQANKASVEAGQKSLEATRAGFDVGTQTMLDVLNAIQTLTQAESSYSQSRHQFILDQLQLKQAAGTIDLKDLEAVNSLLQ